MGITACIHASVSYPTRCENSSLILEKIHGISVIHSIMKACFDSSSIDHVLIVTSNASADDVLLAHLGEIYVPDGKRLECIRIHDKVSYGYPYERSDMAMYTNFPYLRRMLWGMFHVEGCIKIADSHKIQNAILIEADSAWGITPHMIDVISLTLETQKVVRYQEQYPTREVIGLSCIYFKELMQKHESAINVRLRANNMPFSVPHVLTVVNSEEEGSYSLSYETAIGGTVPVLRQQELDMLRYITGDIGEVRAHIFSLLSSYAQLCLHQYLNILIDDSCDVSVLTKQLHEQAQNAIVCHFMVASNQAATCKLVRSAKAQGIISRWVEIEATVLSPSDMDALYEAGATVLIVGVNKIFEDSSNLDRILSYAKEMKSKNRSLCVLVKYVLKTWELSLIHI